MQIVYHMTRFNVSELKEFGFVGVVIMVPWMLQLLGGCVSVPRLAKPGES